VQHLRGEPEALELASAEILDQHVGGLNQLQRNVLLALEIEFHAELVPAVYAEPDGVAPDRRTPAPERIASGRLDLDHLGAEIGQDVRAEWRRDVVAELQNPEPGERAGAGHVRVHWAVLL